MIDSLVKTGKAMLIGGLGLIVFESVIPNVYGDDQITKALTIAYPTLPTNLNLDYIFDL